MRRLSHIAFAALLAAMCVLPAAGQNYKASKVREKSEPEPLEFRKTFILDSEKKAKREIYHDLNGWNPEFDMQFYGSVGFDEKHFSLDIDDLQLGKEKGWMSIAVVLHIINGGIILEFKDIAVAWRNHTHIVLSQKDDSFNRTWLWKVNHNPEVVQAARERSKEIFDTLCASLDKYLKEGPPWELQLVD